MGAELCLTMSEILTFPVNATVGEFAVQVPLQRSAREDGCWFLSQPLDVHVTLLLHNC